MKGTRKLELYQPYAKQKLFHKLGATKRERLLRAGNQQGKTFSGAAEATFHATGRYPDWWEGKVFLENNVGWAAGKTSVATRDSIQRLLLGDMGQPGTGFIPQKDIIGIIKAHGVGELADTILVRHVSGGISRIKLKNYEQGREAWQAESVHWVWPDEEPPEDLYNEALARITATSGIVFITFTPLLGMSEVVRKFLMDNSPDRADINMTIDDAEHIPAKERAAIIAGYPAHEREARINGTPVLGSGRIFPISDSDIMCDPFDMSTVPFFWGEIAGMDFGWDHPTAAAKLLYDPQNDIIYITAVYKRKEATPLIHAAALRSWGKNIVFAWPHDGLQHDKQSGVQLKEAYKAQGLNMLTDHAKFEDGTNGVEAGIADMLMRMETGRLKVFRHLNEFFDEFRLYHRKDGKIVKEYDDILSSCRYAIMMLRYAARVRKVHGVVNGWPIEESDLNPPTHHISDYNPLDRARFRK